MVLHSSYSKLVLCSLHDVPHIETIGFDTLLIFPYGFISITMDIDGPILWMRMFVHQGSADNPPAMIHPGFLRSGREAMDVQFQVSKQFLEVHGSINDFHMQFSAFCRDDVLLQACLHKMHTEKFGFPGASFGLYILIDIGL